MYKGVVEKMVKREKIGYMKYRRIIGIVKIIPVNEKEIQRLFSDVSRKVKS